MAETICGIKKQVQLHWPPERRTLELHVDVLMLDSGSCS